MLFDLGLGFIGQQHRGLDDAFNIMRVLRILLADGCLLRVNERHDPRTLPLFVTSVPRVVAEQTSGTMGSQLKLLYKVAKSSDPMNT
ncbi:unnamed protein product [Protopolystoma xenopodis]|uniref:Exonuclease domain-containing protein n=1 Tax=Protopolystoma xenopodis TaxID=117903 RepID=A0A448WBD0_9PLAT|nr:unnamed protein product [Protopolystoma xenopodis]